MGRYQINKSKLLGFSLIILLVGAGLVLLNSEEPVEIPNEIDLEQEQADKPPSKEDYQTLLAEIEEKRKDFKRAYSETNSQGEKDQIISKR